MNVVRLFSFFEKFLLGLACLLTGAVCHSSEPRKPHRLEVEFLRFEDFGGVKHNGYACDTFFGSKCDPMVYATIQLDGTDPLRDTLPSKTYQTFALLKYVHNSNAFDVGQTIRRDICPAGGSVQGLAAAFVRVIDYDVLKTDLMEDFTCPLSSTIATYDSGWSEVASCLAKYQPSRIKLSYRWRRVPLSATECVQTTPTSFYLPYLPHRLIGYTEMPYESTTILYQRFGFASLREEEKILDYAILSGQKVSP